MKTEGIALWSHLSTSHLSEVDGASIARLALEDPAAPRG